MLQHSCEIISNVPVCGDFYKLEFASDLIAAGAQPGQFLNVRVNAQNNAQLRRPFSVHNAGNGKAEILYKILGQGTASLAKKTAGEKLDIVGPLGKGYSLAGGRAVLIGGGTGVASLFFLARMLKTKKGASVTALIGAKTKRSILCAEEFTNAGCELKTASEDGTLGFKGKVTDLLKKHILQFPTDRIYACGPTPMLKKIAALAGRFKIPCEVSMEEHMACGVGACMGCVTEAKNGSYPRVCKDGPVFDSGEIW